MEKFLFLFLYVPFINSILTFHYYLYLLLALLRHPESIEKIVSGMLLRKIFFLFTIVLKYLILKF